MSDYQLTQNFDAANQAMKLTPAERALYERHLHNLWSAAGIDNPDGSRSTLYQTVLQGPDGKFYNIPTVWDGKILVDRKGNLDMPAILKRVEQAGGWSAFPAYGSPEDADARYKQMHDYMEKDTAAYMDVRKGPLDLTPQRGLIDEGTPR